MTDPLYQYKPFGEKEIPEGGIPDPDVNWDVQDLIEEARDDYGRCKFEAEERDDCMEHTCPLYHTCHRR